MKRKTTTPQKQVLPSQQKKPSYEEPQLKLPKKYMKRNVNLGLLFIIIFLTVGIVSMTLFFKETYSNLQNKFVKESKDLKQTLGELRLNKERLDRTSEELSITSQSTEKMSEIFTEIKDEKVSLESDLSSKQEELIDTIEDYKEADDVKIYVKSKILQKHPGLSPYDLVLLSVRRSKELREEGIKDDNGIEALTDFVNRPEQIAQTRERLIDSYRKNLPEEIEEIKNSDDDRD